MTAFDLRAHTQLLTVAGSRAYGMHRPGSDVDLKGVAIPPARYVLGFTKSFAQADSPEAMSTFWDDLSAAEQEVAKGSKLEGSVYELRKFMRLATDCNPHVLDVLFCRDEEVRIATPVGEAMRALGPAVLSRRARFSFGGYATSQLKRIETHRHWLLNPPAAPPSRESFGLPAVPEISKDKLAAAEAAIRKKLESWTPDFSALEPSKALQLTNHWERTLVELELAGEVSYGAAARTVGLHDDLVGLMTRERAYKSARQQYKQYLGWKRNRNAERAELEAEHGFDTKHGAHLVRLLTMALEIVETGKVNVWRGDRDAEELLAIRAGAWSYDRLMDWNATMKTRLDDAMRTTVLPEHPDRDRLEDAVVEWVATTLRL